MSKSNVLFRRPGVSLLITLSLTLLLGLAPAQQPSSGTQQLVAVEMRNIAYHFTANIVVSIQHLDGVLLPVNGQLAVFDDKNSFDIRIDSAEIAVPVSSLENVLNSNVFQAHD